MGKTIQLNNIKLRQLEKGDVESVFKLRSSPLVGKYIMRPLQKDLSEAYAFINKIEKQEADKKCEYWVIQRNESDLCIGTICLWNFSKDRKTAEVGYDLFPEHQGKGIMSQALKAVLNYGFNDLDLKTIEAFTHKENKSSKRLLEKNELIFQPDRKDEDFPHNKIYIINKK